MEFRLDFSEIERFLMIIEDLQDAVEGLQTQIDKTAKTIKDTNEGIFIDKFEEISENKIEQLDILKEEVENLGEEANRYLDEFQDLDEEKRIGEYKLDTEVEENLARIEKILNQTEYTKNDIKLEEQMEEFSQKVNKYNYIDNTINLEEEYPADEDTQRYIEKKSDEIEKELDDYKRNVETYEEVEQLLNKLESEI